MKIIKEDYQRLKGLCLEVLEKNQGAQIIYKDKGLSEERFRWDLYHKVTHEAQLWGRVEDYLFCRRLYDYLNDDHLDTALKSIVAEYNKKCIEKGAVK